MNDSDLYFIHGGDKLRPSPSKSATLYKVGTKKKGNDGNTWIIVENKNGVKRWSLYKKKTIKKEKAKSKLRGQPSSFAPKSKSKSKSKSKQLDVLAMYDVVHLTEEDLDEVIQNSSPDVRSTYKKVKNLINDLRKLGKLAHIIPLPLSEGGMYWTDYVNDYLNDIYGDDWHKSDHIYFTIKMDVMGKEVVGKDISVDYVLMNRDKKIELIKLLDLHLPKQYIWNGKNTEKIFVTYKKVNQKKINLNRLKDDDVYPMMIISMDFKRGINLFKDESYLFTDILRYVKSYFPEPEYFINHEYGMDDIVLRIYSVPKELYKKARKKIEKYLDPMIKNKTIIKHEIEYYEE